MKNGLTVLCLAAVLGGCMKDGMMLDGAYVRMPEAAINQEPGQAEEPGDRFNEIVENPFIQVSQEPKSTFSVDADGAAYAYFRRMVKMGRLPSPGAVRIEEYLNYFTFDYPENREMALRGYFTVDKGSVTVNGVSLTVCNPTSHTFQVAIIPYTLEHTNFQDIEVGTVVNLEFDILGKYIARLNELKQ